MVRNGCGSQKTDGLEMGWPKKGAWTVCRFTGGLGKKEWVVFWGGARYLDVHTMFYYYKNLVSLARYIFTRYIYT